MFAIRAILAATLSPSLGRLRAGVRAAASTCPCAAGSEEYLDSEKYQLRQWDLHRADSLAPLLGRLNRIRREQPALAHLRTLRFHNTSSEALLCYSKTDPAETGPPVLVVVNLDPANASTGFVDVDLAALGLPYESTYEVVDQLRTGASRWQGAWNFVDLDPRRPPTSSAWKGRDRHEQGPAGGAVDRAADAGRRAAGLVPRRDHLRAARPRVRRLQRRRHRRLQRARPAPRLPRRPRRVGDLAAAVLPVAVARRRLRHRRLPHRPPRLRRPAPVPALPRRRPRPQHPRRSPSSSSTTRPTSTRGSRPPAGRRPVPASATSTCGATRPTATPTPASSSRTSSSPTGRGIRSPSRTSGTASTRTSPTSTTTTPTSRRPSSTSSTTGSTWGSTACASTPCRTCTSARARTARTSTRPTRS